MNSTHTPLGRTPGRHPEAGEDTAWLVTETFRLHQLLHGVAEEMAGQCGLTASRWQVLDALRDRAMTVSSVARRLNLTRQSVQRTARCLEADGFVRFSDNPEHSRADLAALTEKGLEVIEDLDARQTKWITELSQGMPSANIRIGVGMMRGLIGRLSEEE